MGEDLRRLRKGCGQFRFRLYLLHLGKSVKTMGNIIVIFQELKKNVVQLMIDNLEGFTVYVMIKV